MGWISPLCCVLGLVELTALELVQHGSAVHFMWRNVFSSYLLLLLSAIERYKAGVTANGSSQDIKADEDSKIGALIKAFHARMTDRVGVKVEQSRAATSVLHSHHVLAKGDHTRGKVQRTCNSSSICTSNVDELKSNNV